ncbi:D-alanyl-D-alanine carboxypeptidase/D-alanyl-D-alanine endopeptidase [Streptomyces sp. JNUCC 64]
MPELPEPESSPFTGGLAERRKAALAGLRALRPVGLRTWQVTAVAAVTGLALAAGSLAVAGPWDASGQRRAERERAAALRDGGGAHHEAPGGGAGARAPGKAPHAPAVLDALGTTGTAKAPPRGAALGERLGPLVAEAPPGTRTGVSVVDVATGERLWGHDPGKALTPASTTKVATAVAALTAPGPGHQITTRTVLEPASGGKPARLVLVGGGDPTLTARKDARGNASLRDLAKRTAAALERSGDRKVRLGYDTSLYSGPPVHPIGRNDNIATVTALMVDEGRLDGSSSGPAPRSERPARDAADRFAGLLADRGVEVVGAPGGTKAAPAAREVAAVSSPPVGVLVERMLTHSDNDLAEALARQVALASGEDAGFRGAEAAVKRRLGEVGVPLGGARFADGSGLDRADRLPPATLTALLAAAARADRPALRPALTGLPVAGFTGTLRNRYSSGSGEAATGFVRAKTGTLTGVHALAGTVVDRDGRLLAFAFLSDGPPTDPAVAQGRLDRMAATLAACGCA